MRSSWMRVALWSSSIAVAHLTAIANNWGAYYRTRVQAALDGSWEAGDTWWGIKEDVIQMTPNNAAIPADVQQAAEDVRSGIGAGMRG